MRHKEVEVCLGLGQHNVQIVFGGIEVAGAKFEAGAGLSTPEYLLGQSVVLLELKQPHLNRRENPGIIYVRLGRFGIYQRKLVLH